MSEVNVAAALREHTADIRRAPTFAPQAYLAVAENPTTRSTPRGGRIAHLPRVLASAVVVVAAVGYVVFVKSTRIDRASLSALVIDRTAVTALKSKPVESEFVSPQKSAFAAVKKAAASDPGGTGGYGKEWSGSTASGDAATQLVEILPSSAQARSVRAEAEAEYSDASSLKAAHTAVTAHFSVPTVAGAFGVSLATAKSSTTSATTGTAIVFQQGRVVAVEYLQSSTGGLSRTDATTMARAEDALLERNEPSFSLTRTTRPLALSVVYVLVTLLVAGLTLLVPGLVRRRRARRHARREEQARYEYRARGGKAMRRRRQPAWAQRARSAGSLR
ncbi:MAG: hypothetical protein ABSH29_02180 [Acidimicrobiales bacterium]